jgi:hypothetical protein
VNEDGVTFEAACRERQPARGNRPTNPANDRQSRRVPGDRTRIGKLLPLQTYHRGRSKVHYLAVRQQARKITKHIARKNAMYMIILNIRQTVKRGSNILGIVNLLNIPGDYRRAINMFVYRGR